MQLNRRGLFKLIGAALIGSKAIPLAPAAKIAVDWGFKPSYSQIVFISNPMGRSSWWIQKAFIHGSNYGMSAEKFKQLLENKP